MWKECPSSGQDGLLGFPSKSTGSFKCLSHYGHRKEHMQERRFGRFHSQLLLLQACCRRALAMLLLINSFWPESSNFSPPAQLPSALLPSHIDRGNLRFNIFSSLEIIGKLLVCFHSQITEQNQGESKGS